MIRISTLAMALLSAIVFAGALSALEVGEDAPDFEFEKQWNLPEEATTLKAYQGKVVLLEWWATW